MGSFERHHFSDQLSIDTPEQVDLRFSVAGIGSRLVAALLDGLLILAFFFAEGLILVAVAAATAATRYAGRGESWIEHWATAILVFLNFLVVWGYFAIFEAVWRGQTPGKRVMKLRVLKDSGRQITFFEALARNLMRFVDYMPGFYLVGVITMLCNKRNKRLGDLVVGTIVIHERLADQPLMVQQNSLVAAQAPAWQAQPVPAVFPADAIARLGQQDLVVIDAFFARALDLSLETRAAMAQRITRQMAERMDVPVPEGNPERALESILYAIRGGAHSLH
jgi:uncharacterized RDD family membrane protein YckC